MSELEGHERRTPDEAFVREFAASMPAHYRMMFEDEAVEAHAGVAFRRDGAAVRVEVWKELPERVVCLCIVADDVPGVLARITAALAAHDVDVVAGQVYGRHVEERSEAVDLFWIRR